MPPGLSGAKLVLFLKSRLLKQPADYKFAGELYAYLSVWQEVFRRFKVVLGVKHSGKIVASAFFLHTEIGEARRT